MISNDDLNWWLEFAADREWTFAKTYIETAPHHYVVEDRTPGVTHEDMVRAARVIHTFGTPGKYYSLTKIYLHSPDGKYRWWTEDRHFTDTTLVNQATTELFYGIQNAPSTVSGIDSVVDGLATYWDAIHPIGDGEVEFVHEVLSGIKGKYPPHVLDIGCGTGRVLDLGLVSPDRYAALDCSQAMLNLLLRKHPRTAAVYPVDVCQALAAGTFTPGQFDWVFLDEAVRLNAVERAKIDEIARIAVITVKGKVWGLKNVSAASVQRIRAWADASRVTP